MVTMMMLAAVLTTQDPSVRHVRASEPRIIALIDAGLSRSATFRRLVDVLDQSDVIVYVDPKQTRTGLSAYLAHNLIASGGYRYVHIALEAQGATVRLIALLAHELQHAVEVAQAPDVRDAESLVRMFERSTLKFGCASGAGECYETKAAKDIEAAVLSELKASRLARPKGMANRSFVEQRRQVQDDRDRRRHCVFDDRVDQKALPVS